MLCGADTVKPDTQITKAVVACTGKNPSSKIKVQLLEESANQLGIRAQQLDYALWNYYSKKAQKGRHPVRVRKIPRSRIPEILKE